VAEHQIDNLEVSSFDYSLLDQVILPSSNGIGLLTSNERMAVRFRPGVLVLMGGRSAARTEDFESSYASSSLALPTLV
jgi:hypothetical protein